MRLLMEFGMGTVRCWLAEDAVSGRRLELTEVESVRFADSGRVRTVEELARGLARRRELGWPESLTVYFAGGRFEATREQWKVLGGDVIEGIAMGKTLELGAGVGLSVPGGDAAVVAAGSAVIVGEGNGVVAAGAGPGRGGVGVALVEVGAADHVPVVGAVTAPVRVEDGEQQQDVSKGHGDRVVSAGEMGKRTLVTGGASCTGMGRVAI